MPKKGGINSAIPLNFLHQREMLQITHLSYRYKAPHNIPYYMVNCTFKVSEGKDPWFRERVLRDCQWITLEPVFDSVDDVDRASCWKNEKYVVKDNNIEHIEKFDTFWFRDCCAASPITLECLRELSFYKEYGKLPSTYRHADYAIAYQHLKTLWGYYD